MGSIQIEKQLHIRKLYIKSRSNKSFGLFDDVEFDGYIRFLIHLRISDNTFYTKMAIFRFTSGFPGTSGYLFFEPFPTTCKTVWVSSLNRLAVRGRPDLDHRKKKSSR